MSSNKIAEQENLETMAAGAAIDEQTPVTPVRSAKDAINAMYAQDSSKRLSNYLAASAQEIINANSRPSDTKSATNLHRGSINHRLEYAQPSASGMLRSAKPKQAAVPSDVSSAMDPLARKTTPSISPRPAAKARPITTPPVVKTSLKLDPKKSPVRMAPQNIKNQPRQAVNVSPQKGTTNLEKLLASRQQAHPVNVPNTVTSAIPRRNMEGVTRTANHANPNIPNPLSASESIKVVQQASAKAINRVPRPAQRPHGGLMQDIIRPQTTPVTPVTPVDDTPADVPESIKPSKSATKGPFDSIKRRFRPAPKGYAKKQPDVQPAGYVGFEDESIDTNISETETPPTPPVTPKPPIEIYGLMEDEPVRPASPDGLGVVEDYHRQGDAAAQPTPDTSKNNQKYSVKGQSPFFLKSVKVEKRPLSEIGQGAKQQAISEGTLYEKPSNEPVGKKNVYEKQSKSKKQAVPSKPTVIVPASRKSKAPIIFLMLLTVILGAAVGAFAYLCFFQYME